MIQDPIICVEAVEKSFPTVFGASALFRYGGRAPRAIALHDISLEVKRGELFGLLGPNGAGKTTLMKLMATLAIPDRGRITIDGIDVARNAQLAKSRIGLCTSEERSFYFRLTARENLEFFGALAGLKGKQLKARVEEVVELIDLTSAIDRRFGGFSSGMRQRLAVGRALLADPAVIFLDEPTRAVDPVHADDLRVLIREELVGRRGKTVILATNLLDEAWSICDRVAVFSNGTIVACGPPRALDTKVKRVARYEIAIDQLDDALILRARGVRGVISTDVRPHLDGFMLGVDMDPTDRSLTELMYAVSSNGTLLRDIRPVEPQPVDVFRELMEVGHR